MSETSTEPVKNLKSLAAALGMTEEKLQALRQTEWFPALDDVKDEDGAYNVELIIETIRERSGSIPPGASVSSLESDGESYELPVIVDGKDPDGNAMLEIKLDRVFRAACPNDTGEGRRHRARVKEGRTKGRKRACICDTCGTSFTQIADYACPKMELLHRMQRLLENADIGEAEGVKFVLISAETCGDFISAVKKVKSL